MEIETTVPHEQIEPGIEILKECSISGHGTEAPSFKTAVAFIDDPEANFMGHYFHFMEYMIAVVHALDRAGIPPTQVDLVLFPEIRNDSWKGSFHDHNLHLLKSYFPAAAAIYNRPYLEQHIRTLNIKTCLTIRRSSMDHRDINKMCGGIFSKINDSAIQAFVDATYAYWKLEPLAEKGPVAVTYISRRRSKRRYPGFVEKKLERAVSAIEGVRFRKVRMEELGFKEQIQLAYETDVMISIHGNGLTHSFFMRPDRVMIEIFPKGTFQFDYFSFARLRHHSYYAFNAGRLTPPRDYYLHGSTSRWMLSVNAKDIAGIISSNRHFL